MSSLPSVTSSMSWSDDGKMKEKGTDESLSLRKVVGVVTPFVGGVAQAFHDDQVVELRVQLGVQEVEGKEDREEQVEVERERRVKEVRPWI